jgi:hypothetical protein
MFRFKQSKTATETNSMLKLAFRDETMIKTQTCDWFSKLEIGVTLLTMLRIHDIHPQAKWMKM